MSSVYSDGSYLTLQGYALLAKCIALGQPLKFIKATAGDGFVPAGTAPDAMTELNHYVTDAIIADKKDLGGGEYQVDIQISTTATEDGFNCSEIMLWAENPDDVGGTPIGYTYFSLQQHPEWIRPNAGSVGKFFTVSLVTIVSGAPIVDATINASATVTVEMLNNALAGVSGAVLSEITIPAEAWTQDTGGGGIYPYYADVAVEEAQASYFPVAAIHKESLETAAAAGMASVLQVLEGKVRFWSKEPSQSTLYITLALLSGSQGSTGQGYGMVNTTADIGEKDPIPADMVTYDNSKSKIDATTAQEALDFVLGLSLPRLTVTIDAGSTLTISCGDERIEGQSDEEGTFSTSLPMLGTWQIVASKDGQTSTQTVDVNQVGRLYVVEMAYFSAALTATAVSGATVTATCGDTVVTKVADSGGQAVLEIKLPGNYVVQATMSNSYGNATSSSQEVNVEDNGGSYSATVKFIRLTVTIDEGSQVVISKDDTEITITSTGADQVYLPSTGTWTVTATKDDLADQQEVECADYQDYDVELAYVKEVFAENEWNMVRRVSDAGEGANWWAVGDTKPVPLSGTVGSLNVNGVTLDAFILSFNHNEAKEGDRRIHLALGKIDGKMIALCDSQYNSSGSSTAFRMNTSNTNSGGWNASYMRKTILGNSGTPDNPPANSLLAALPADLRAVMKSVTKYTDNVGNDNNNSSSISATVDWLFLFAEYEVHGSRNYANSYEQNSQQQYDYFKAGNSKVSYRHDSTGSAVVVWRRSPYYASNTFCATDAGGGYTTSYANYSFGVQAGFAA